MRQGSRPRWALRSADRRQSFRPPISRAGWLAGALVIGIVATVLPSLANYQTDAVIRGVVGNEAGGRIAGARVIAWPALGPPATRAPGQASAGLDDIDGAFTPPETRSDDEGMFLLPVLPGVHHVVVRVPGYRWGHRLGIEVAADEPVDLGSISLARGVSVAGTLLHSDGEPAGGIPITLYEGYDMPAFLPEDQFEKPSMTTTADGGFRFDGLAPAAIVDLLVEPDELTRKYKRLSTPTAEAGEHRIELVIDRPRVGATVTIEVVSNRGEPINDAHLYIQRVPTPPSSGGSIAQREFFDPVRGQYRSKPRQPGRYRLIARAPWHRGQELPDLELIAGDNGTIRVELVRVPSTRVDGMLTTAEGVPLRQHEVEIVLQGELPGRGDRPDGDLGLSHVSERAMTDAEGRFSFAEIPEGRYELRARDLGFGLASRQIEVLATEAAGFDLAFAPAEGPVGSIDVVVLDPEGNPVPDAHVSVARRSEPNRSMAFGDTNADGRFAFRALVDDAAHAISVSKPGYEESSLRQRLDETDVETELAVTLVPHDRGGATVIGRIIGVHADELHRLQLSGYPAYVRSDGSFVMHGVPPGDHELIGYMPGWSPVEVPLRFSVPTGGGTVDVGDIVIERFAVGGAVYYQGEPLTTGSVELRPAERRRHYGGGFASLIDGRFDFPRVQAGEYHLVVGYDGWGRIHDEVIEVRRDRELDLRLGAAMASGSVTDAASGAPLGGDRLSLGFVCTGCTTRSHERPDSIEVGPDGQWRAGPLEAGTWRLRLNRRGYVAWEETIEVAGRDVQMPIEMMPTPGLDLTFRTENGTLPPWVRTRLYDEVGETVARESFYPERSRFPAAHWDGAPTGTWLLEAWGRYALPVRQRVTVPGPGVTLDLPAQGQLLARLPALEELSNPNVAALVVLDARRQLVAGYTEDGVPTERWRASTAGEIRGLNLPPGRYTARVTSGDRVWEEPFEIEAFARTTVTLRGPGR